MNQVFLNCDFQYECPKNWFGLGPTSKASIKHCKECKKDVHLCINQEELDYAISQKHCIAYFQDPSLQTRFKLSREKSEANRADPDFQLNLVLGLPKNLHYSPKSGVEILLESNYDIGEDDEDAAKSQQLMS